MEDRGQAWIVAGVDRMLAGWTTAVRLAAISVFWALTAWPMVTLPAATVGASRAWAAHDQWIPWRAYVHGVREFGGRSYAVGVPWALEMLVSWTLIKASVREPEAAARLFGAVILCLDVVMTLWALAAWARLAQGEGTAPAVVRGLAALGQRPMVTLACGAILLSTVALGAWAPVLIPLLWGAAIAGVGAKVGLGGRTR